MSAIGMPVALGIDMANDIIAAKQAAETAYTAWITAVNAQDEEPTPVQRQLVRQTVQAYHKALATYNRLRNVAC